MDVQPSGWGIDARGGGRRGELRARDDGSRKLHRSTQAWPQPRKQRRKASGSQLQSREAEVTAQHALTQQ